MYWLFKFVLFGPVLWLLFRPKAEGSRNVPARGPAILASNHVSLVDPGLMPLTTRRKVTFLAKIEYFTGRGLKGLLVKLFFLGVGAIPVDRSGGRSARAAIDTALRVLREGGVFGIYPEGTRSPDGRVYRGKMGVARLALESGAPLVPVAMLNADEVLPLGSLRPRFGQRVRIRFGAPLDLSRYAGKAGDRVAERAVADELMQELVRLSGREYVDVYSEQAKAAARRAARNEAARNEAAENEAAENEAAP